MVRFAKYAIDDFFLSAELDAMVQNNEDVPDEPLCIPEDSLDAIYMYPMEEVQGLLAEHEGTATATAMAMQEDVIEANTEGARDLSHRGRGRPRKRREDCTDGLSSQDSQVRRRGRPTKARGRSTSLELMNSHSREEEEEEEEVEVESRGYNGAVPKRRRSHGWSVLPPVLPLARQKQSGDRRDNRSSETVPLRQSAVRRCSRCMAEDTPQWRQGPDGPGTLCNACGIKFKNGRLEDKLQ